eukprot:gene10645-13042_t
MNGVELSTTSAAYNALVSAENSVKGTSNTVIIYKPPSDLTILPGAVITEEEQQQKQIEKLQSLMYSTKDAGIIDSIFKHIVQNQIDILRKIFLYVEKQEYQQLSKIIITFAIGCNNALRIIRYFIHSDVQEDTNNINKNYSLSSLLISYFLEKIGQQYMKDVLRPFILQVVENKSLNLQKELESGNYKNLSEWLEKLTQLITNQDSIDKLPVPIKIVAMFFHEIWPQDENNLGISNFIFNKFFVPALMTPELYNLIPQQIHLSSRSSSNLLILARGLSHAITGSVWEYENPELTPIKSTLKSILRETLYFKSVLGARFSTQSYQYSNEAPMSQLHTLHRIFSQRKSEIKQMFKNESDGNEFEKYMDGILDYQFKVNHQFLTPQELKTIKQYIENKNEEISYIGYIQKNGKRGVVKRVLVIGIYKIMTFKVGGRIGREGHLLELVKISSPAPQQFEFEFKTTNPKNPSGPTIDFKINATSEDCDHIITCIRRIYEYSLNNWPYSQKMKLNVQPPSRLEAISPPDHTPTSSMVSAYKSLCSFYQIPVKQTVCWYIENAFLDAKQKVFNLKLFSKHTREPSTNQDLIPLIHSLRFDWFFEEFIIKSYPVTTKELVKEIANMLSFNSTFTSLVLSNLNMPKESMMSIFDVLQAQRSMHLTHLDVSKNVFDEKSLNSLLSYIQAGSTSKLKRFVLSYISIPPNGVKPFFDSMKRGNFSSLEYFSFSGNKLAENSFEVSRWLSNEGSHVKELDLSNTMLKPKFFQIDAGKSQLERLDLSKNPFRERDDLLSITNLVSSLLQLKSISLQETLIPSDTMKDIVASLSTSNRDLQHLIVSRNSLTRVAITGLISSLSIHHIKKLDLSDNDNIGDGGIKELGRALYGNQTINSLNISGCFKGSEGVQRSKAILALSNYITSSSSLETLYMRGGEKSSHKLQRCIIPLLLSLGSTHTLRTLDISNHSIGSQGAVALAKSIYQNKSISKLIWDNNNVGSLGYANIKNSLKKNYTIKEMPIPIYDINLIISYDGTTVIEQKKLRSLLLKIELYLSRNQDL